MTGPSPGCFSQLEVMMLNVFNVDHLNVSNLLMGATAVPLTPRGSHKHAKSVHKNQEKK